MKKWIRSSLFIALGTFAYASAEAQISLTLIANVNLTSTSNASNAEFIGNNPSAVAWNGLQAWVGGYNGSGSVANTAIAPVTNLFDGTPVLGAAFGQFATNGSRGLSGLAIQGTTLAVALDDGAGSGDSIRALNSATGSLLWRIGAAGAGNDSSRRGNGVAFDPGFNGASGGQGVAYLSIGSGRRHLLNPTTGAYLFGQNAGMIINLNPVSTTWRGLTFDPDNGDLYTRESNQVTKIARTGDNSASGPSTLLGGLTKVTNIDNQNIAFVKSEIFNQKFLIFNDRTVTTAGQTFSSVVKALDTSGNAVALNFGTFAPANGNGAYNFSFDLASQTLAMTDFANRRLYVFKVARAASFQGTITFPELEAGAANQQIEFAFRAKRGGAVLKRTVSIPPSGAFSITDLPGDDYDILIDGANYLARNVSLDARAGGAFALNASLIVGDIVPDNIIDLLDLVALFDSYGLAEEDPGYSALADLNGDAIVDLLDLVILFNGYGEEGDL